MRRRLVEEDASREASSSAPKSAAAPGFACTESPGSDEDVAVGTGVTEGSSGGRAVGDAMPLAHDTYASQRRVIAQFLPIPVLKPAHLACCLNAAQSSLDEHVIRPVQKELDHAFVDSRVYFPLKG